MLDLKDKVKIVLGETASSCSNNKISINSAFVAIKEKLTPSEVIELPRGNGFPTFITFTVSLFL